MGKDKYKRFCENETFSCLVQPQFDEIFKKDHKLKSRWRSDFFNNDNPIILELGCGRGEYTVEMGLREKSNNYIGIDIKGARLWRGAKTATEDEMGNIGFLRTRIEFIESFFGTSEVDEIWITFPDPQLKAARAKKRLTAPGFLEMYGKFLKSDGIIHLKTDSLYLHEYTKAVIKENDLTVHECCDDIYGKGFADEKLSIKTKYEQDYLKQDLPITYIKFSLSGKTTFKNVDFDSEEMLEKLKR